MHTVAKNKPGQVISEGAIVVNGDLVLALLATEAVVVTYSTEVHCPVQAVPVQPGPMHLAIRTPHLPTQLTLVG
jgi:hypothetical protein